MIQWYFYTLSKTYGRETYGPYESYEEARDAIARVQKRAGDMDDGVDRLYSDAYSR